MKFCLVVNNGNEMFNGHECRAKCGTPHTMSFHYKQLRKDKIGECKCGDISLSGTCLTKFIQEASDLRSSFADLRSSFADSNYNSSSNLQSNFANSNSN